MTTESKPLHNSTFEEKGVKSKEKCCDTDEDSDCKSDWEELVDKIITVTRRNGRLNAIIQWYPCTHYDFENKACVRGGM